MKIRILGLALCCASVLASCTDDNPVSNSDNKEEPQASALDPGPGYKEQVLSVTRHGKQDGQVTMRYYTDMPGVAYISWADFQRLMLPKSTASVTRSGDSYVLTNDEGSATVDVTHDRFVSTNLIAFTNMMSQVKPGLPNISYRYIGYMDFEGYECTPQQATTTLDFGKYGIDLRDDGQNVYFPFITLNDIYTDDSGHTAFFNGDKIELPTREGIPDVMGEMRTRALTTTEVTEDYARYRYAELCFVMDNIFGYPGRTELEIMGMQQNGLDATLDQVECGKLIKQLLKSKVQAEYMLATDALYHLLRDGGHTDVSLVHVVPRELFDEVSARYTATGDKYPELFAMINRKDAQEKEESKAIDALKEKRNAQYGGRTYITSSDLRTAVLVIDGFPPPDYDAWNTYYDSGKTKADWEQLMKTEDDIVVRFLRQLQLAKQAGVKNLVIDLSLNTGGNDTSCECVTAIIGDQQAVKTDRNHIYVWEQNALTGQSLTTKLAVDLNFDGKFDDLDWQTNWTEGLNIVALTSISSFSNGNALAARMSDFGYEVWGQRSGGGACAVRQVMTQEGFIYTIASFRSRYSTINWRNIDEGIAPDKELTADQMYDVEYLNSLFK